MNPSLKQTFVYSVKGAELREINGIENKCRCDEQDHIDCLPLSLIIIIPLFQ